MQHSDFCVKKKSSCLNGVYFDLVISGSIAAIESVKFIRELRRLGASVQATLTHSAKQFITDTAIQWACGGTKTKAIEYIDDHLSTNHGLLIIPASANTLSKLNLGLADTPSATLALSYLGGSRPIFILPNMHHSMYLAPILQQHISSLKQNKSVVFLNPKMEEEKLKMPPIDILANHIAHHYNQRFRKKKVLITMGPTYEPLDDVRGISNLSTGKLGSLIAEELYRLGFETLVVCGPARYIPRSYTNLYKTRTAQDMLDAIQHAMTQEINACIFSAAVSDYTAEKKYNGKIDSSLDKWTIQLQRSEKIIAQIHPCSKVKVGFKLQSHIKDTDYLCLAKKYMKQYNLSQIVINDVTLLQGKDEHPAIVFERQDQLLTKTICYNKNEIAKTVTQHLIKRL